MLGIGHTEIVYRIEVGQNERQVKAKGHGVHSGNTTAKRKRTVVKAEIMRRSPGHRNQLSNVRNMKSKGKQ